MTPPTEGELVLPGDLLGTAEEFVPGHGTYEDGGRIYAALMGRRTIDPRDKAVRVEAVHPIPSIAEGDLVYGRVDEVKSAMAIVTILALASGKRAIPGAPEGTIHISKAKEGYTETLGEEFAAGDIVLARVLQSQPTVKLTTAPSNLGVVSARCQACHGLLTLGGKEITCPRCGNREHRKSAKGYLGLGTPPAEHAPAPD